IEDIFDDIIASEVALEVIEIIGDEPESAAAKLARIREVVAADRAAEDDMADDTLAAAFAETGELDSAPEKIESEAPASAPLDVTAVSDDIEAAYEHEEGDAFDDDFAAFFAGVDDSSAEVDETEMSAEPDETGPAETVDETTEPEADRQDGSDVVAAETADADPLVAEQDVIATAAEETFEETAASADEVPEDPTFDAAESAENVATESNADNAVAPTRVIRVRKVRRFDATSAATAGASDTTDEDATDLDAATVEDAQTLAPSVRTTSVDAVMQDDDEADLMAELAAIEAELDREPTGKTVEAQHADDVEDALADDSDLMAELAAIRADETPADTRITSDLIEPTLVMDEDEETQDPILSEPEDELLASDDEDDSVGDAKAEDMSQGDPEDLERLFAATDSRLSGEDTSRRHANISHLKAAVAARRADDTMETVKSDDTGAYREDLASTVRPRRAAAPAEARTSRPERPAPLVLVSEQRVEDEAEAIMAAPVTPRRAPRLADADLVQDAAMDVPGGPQTPEFGDDVEQFAQDVGATDLADILEAAAVYSATVMGQDSFSRPRLLHLAAEAVDDLSREDGLRGFGQLLRDGTLRKVSRGTFALGADSRFRDQAERRVG
ncbi:MAG: hypothetical protein WBA67_10255, partial [Jannaschia sp.]